MRGFSWGKYKSFWCWAGFVSIFCIRTIQWVLWVRLSAGWYAVINSMVCWWGKNINELTIYPGHEVFCWFFFFLYSMLLCRSHTTYMNLATALLCVHQFLVDWQLNSNLKFVLYHNPEWQNYDNRRVCARKHVPYHRVKLVLLSATGMRLTPMCFWRCCNALFPFEVLSCPNYSPFFKPTLIYVVCGALERWTPIEWTDGPEFCCYCTSRR